MSPPAENIGDNVFCDIIPFSCTTIGGFNHGLLLLDEKSAFPMMVGLVAKTEKRLTAAIIKADQFYRRFGHQIRRISPDAERCLIATQDNLGDRGIHVTPSIPGQACKRVERLVQTAKDRINTTKASTGFKIPAFLDGELWVYVLNHLSIVPSSALAGDVPFLLFTKTRPDFNGWVSVPFGRVAQFNSIEGDRTMVFGLTLGGKWASVTSTAVKGYIPSTQSVITRAMRNTVMVKYNVPPQEWGWETQIAAPAYSIESGAHRLLNATDIDNAPVATTGPDPTALPTVSNEVPTVTNDNPASVPTNAIEVPTVTNDNPASAPTTANEEPAVTNDDPPPLLDSDSEEEEDDDDARRQPGYVPFSEMWRRRLLDRDPPTSVAYPITYEQAKKGEHAEDADAAVNDEFVNIETNNVWRATAYSDLSQEDIDSAVPSGLYIKYKTNPVDGAYDKSKARLHAGGHKQRSDHFESTASYMINIMIVFMMLKVMSALNWMHAVFDIKGAYLHAPRTHVKPQYMWLSERLTALWLLRHPEDRPKVHRNRLYVLLLRALYGLKDSGRLWYDYLTAFLLRHGFVISESDPCLYLRYVSATNFCYVLTHVDDLLVLGLGVCFTSFKDTLAETFPEFSSKFSNTFAYLGMTIIRKPEEHAVTINQRSYIQTMLDTFGLADCTPVSSPASSNLLSAQEDESGPCNVTNYLSMVMSLMYCARISRPDILFVVTFLATKSATPTMNHLAAAKRVLRYLKGTIDLALRYAGTTIHLCIYADASHGVHPDGRGQMAMVITLGDDEVIRTSHKMKCVTLSSTESEIVAAVDAATYVRWLVKLFQELRLPVQLPIDLKQDNQSAIHMMTNGTNFRRTKHMVIKGEFVRELVDDGWLRLIYAESADMNADQGTKPYTGHQLVRYTARVFCKLDD
jgi:hypothetical protein